MLYDNFYEVMAEDQAGQYSVDGIRKYPINKFIIHHGGGDPCVDYSATEVIDTISELHRVKPTMYNGGKDVAGGTDSFHDHRLKDCRVYCAYHFLAWWNLGGWEIVPTMKGVIQNVAGGTWLYDNNKQAIQLCVLGNYLNQDPRPGLTDAICDFFQGLSKYVHNQYNVPLQIHAHKDFDATTCPGRITQYFDEINRRLN
jgi:hypothetical protein